MTAPYFGKFDLNIAAAIADQLGGFLEALSPESLANEDALQAIPESSGVYCLFYQGEPVYIGQTSRALPVRLREHAEDFDGRRNISRHEVGFTCAILSNNWRPFGAEKILMSRSTYRWQGSGFGSNDVGVDRDNQRLREQHWDLQFPIRTDFPCDWIHAGTYPASALLDLLKDNLPFTFRFQRDGTHGHSPHMPDVLTTIVNVTAAGLPFWEIMRLITAALPGWQATALPGWSIFYKNIRQYRHATDYWRNEG